MLFIFVFLVSSALAIAISSVACAGDGGSSVGIGERFSTISIYRSGTPARMEQGETPGAVQATSESWWARASAVAYLSSTCFRSLSYLNGKGSRSSSSSLFTAFAPKSLGWAPSMISTCKYLALAPLLIILLLMLS